MRLTVDRSLLVIFVAIVCTTLAQPPVIGRLPTRYILRDQFGLSASDMAVFFSIAAIPWYFKPLAGLLTDRVRIGGTRRRHYILASAATAAVLWFALAAVELTYASLLVGIGAINAVMMLGSAALGGFFVDYGQQQQATGTASSVVQTARTVVGLVSGPLSGYLASFAFAYTCVTGGLILLPFFVASLWLLREPGRGPTADVRGEGPGRPVSLSGVIFHAPMWVAAGMLALIFLTPGFVTPLWYHQVDTLKLSPQFIGTLDAIGSACGLIGAAVYAAVCRTLTLRRLLYVGVAADVVTTLAYLGYDSPAAAIAIAAVGGFVGVVTLVALIDLAARSAPPGAEALGYALLMTAWNFSMSMSDMLGSWLLDSYSVSLKELVWLNAAASAAVFPIVYLLPATLVDTSDSRRGCITPHQETPDGKP